MTYSDIPSLLVIFGALVVMFLTVVWTFWTIIALLQWICHGLESIFRDEMEDLNGPT